MTAISVRSTVMEFLSLSDGQIIMNLSAFIIVLVIKSLYHNLVLSSVDHHMDKIGSIADTVVSPAWSI